MAKKTIAQKEPVKLREKKLSNGNISLYLDIYRNGKAARSNRTRPGRENTLDNGEEDFHAPAVCRHWQDCDGRILSQQNKSLKVAGLNGCNTW